MARQDGTPKRGSVDEARAILRVAIPRAAEVLVAMLEAEDPALRLRAAAAILNRSGLTEADRPRHYIAAREVGGEENALTRELGL